MTRAMINSMTEVEQRLIAETEPAELRELDEDALLELHARIRRARNKYVTLYRRRAADRAPSVGGRGKAYAQNQRDRDKAEVFEQVLARVSRAVAAAARQSAADLRAERLAAARAAKGQAPAAALLGTEVAPSDGSGRVAAHSKTTGGLKRDASSRAQGGRRQAKRDGR